MRLRCATQRALGAVLGGVSVLLAAVWPTRDAQPQPFSPYSEFQSMSLADLATLQVKVTYAGTQTVGTRSLMFTALGNQADIGLFTPYRRNGLDYANDEGPPLTFTATVEELKAVIESVGTVPDVTDGDVDPEGYVSFALLNTAGVTRVFEAVVNDTTGPLLVAGLLAGLRTNVAGKRMVSAFGCGAGIMPANTPENLEGRVSVTFSGLRRDRPTGRVFVGRVRITNTSKSTIAPPLSLVVVRHGNAELLDATGETCNIHPPGFPYIDLSTASGLAPGATIQRNLRFDNPTLEKFTVSFRTFGGPGTR